MNYALAPIFILFPLFVIVSIWYSVCVDRLLQKYDVIHDYRTSGPWLSWIKKKIRPILREDDLPLYNRIVLTWNWTTYLGISMLLWLFVTSIVFPLFEIF